ncbi:MAG: hypothetical protein J0J06_08805 [Sphingomonas sp.]|uniref:hypothetical protein n=1 Tax=Sphingomonas sp. TaxID=28214 RepID=UPI001AC24EDA|nr:hypothetical protein [Sphingomonas sp.]MBN8815530.1 hypothetical protein [Sphingomonas sp.]
MEVDDGAAVAAPGRWPQAILAAIVVVAFLAAQLLSDRPQLPLKRPWIDHVADLPVGSDLDRYTSYAYATTAILPTGRRLTVPELNRQMAALRDPKPPTDVPAKLGYSITEYVALAMPFFAQKDFGYTLYVDDGGQYMYFAPLGDEGIAKLREELKTPIGEDYTFRWWNHMWGWIPLLALIGIVVLEVRRARIKRLHSGIL